MMLIEFICMALAMLSLTAWVYSLKKRIEEQELHSRALWETMGRMWEEVRADRKRIEALEEDGSNHDGNTRV